MPQTMKDLLNNIDWKLLVNDPEKFQGSYTQTIEKAIKTLPDDQMTRGLSLLQINQLILNLSAIQKYQKAIKNAAKKAYINVTQAALTSQKQPQSISDIFNQTIEKSTNTFFNSVSKNLVNQDKFKTILKQYLPTYDPDVNDIASFIALNQNNHSYLDTGFEIMNDRHLTDRKFYRKVLNLVQDVKQVHQSGTLIQSNQDYLKVTHRWWILWVYFKQFYRHFIYQALNLYQKKQLGAMPEPIQQYLTDLNIYSPKTELIFKKITMNRVVQ